jgi:hypothetical protein
MPLAAWLEDYVARAAYNHVVSEQRPYAALQHETVLVLARTPMHGGREGARLHGMLH